MIYVPPNGFIGAGQQTQAAQLIEMGGMRRNGGTKRRRKRKSSAKRAAPRRAKRRTSSSSRKRAGKAKRFVKGSAAAKRHMAKLRRMRKR